MLKCQADTECKEFALGKGAEEGKCLGFKQSCPTHSSDTNYNTYLIPPTLPFSFELIDFNSRI